MKTIAACLLIVFLNTVALEAKVPLADGRFEVKSIKHHLVKTLPVKAQLSPETESELNKITNDRLRLCVTRRLEREGFNSLDDLKSLTCYGTSSIGNLYTQSTAGINVLRNLEYLNLHYTKTKYLKLINISDLSKLKTIDLSNNRNAVIEGLDQLKAVPAIESINLTEDFKLSCAEIKDLVINLGSDVSVMHNCHGNALRIKDIKFADPQLASAYRPNLKSDRIYQINNYIGRHSYGVFKSLKGVEHFINLQYINLYQRSDTTALSLKPLNKLKNLSVINIYQKVKGFDAIETLPHLKTLSLDQNSDPRSVPFDLLNFLLRLPKLEHLHLSNIGSVSNTYTFTKIKPLKSLDLYNVPIKTAFFPSYQTQLESIFIGNGALTEVPKIEGKNTLKYLGLGSNQIKNISNIGGLTEIISLDLSDNLISDINPLSSLKKITGLYLSANQIEDLSDFPHLSANLSYLSLDDNLINDFSGLAHVKSAFKDTEYSIIDLSGNRIESLAALNTFNGLHLGYLDLSDNRIDDNGALLLSPIDNLHISSLNLSNNHIKDCSNIIKNLNQINYFSFQNNFIEDLSSLESIPKRDISLDLSNNYISNIGSVLNLINGTYSYIDLSFNFISDLDPILNDLDIDLNSLYLSHNPINNDSLKVFDQLQSKFDIGSLDLSYTQISDLRPLINFLKRQVGGPTLGSILLIGNSDIPESQIKELRDLAVLVYY